MEGFGIKLKITKDKVEDLKKIENEIKSIIRDIDSISSTSGISSSAYRQLKKSLKRIKEDLKNESVDVKDMKKALQAIIKLYEKAERNILGETLVSEISQKLKEYISELREKEKELAMFLNGLIVDYCSFDGDPVNMSTGNYILEKEELYIKSVYPIFWKRFYNALSEDRTALGNGWNYNHNIFIVQKGENWILHEAGGKNALFTKREDGLYKSETEQERSLSKTTEGYYIIKGGTVSLVFNEQGKIIKKLYDNGNCLIYIYKDDKLSKIESNDGQYINIYYNDDGFIIKVESCEGKKIEYSYDDGNLVKVNNQGEIVQYKYTNNHKLSKVINPTGKVLVINDYDDKNRIVCQTYPDGGKMNYQYEDNQIILTRQNGIKVIYEHDEMFRHIKTIHSDGEEAFTYDKRNRKTSFTNKKGDVTRWTYDDRGNITSIIDPLGNKRSMTYNKDNKLISVREPNGAQTAYHYDLKGNLIEIIGPEGGKTCLENDEAGRPIKIVLPGNSAVLISYDKKGNILSRNQDNAIFDYFSYDENSNLISYKDGEGNETKYEYDERGRLTTVLLPTGDKRVSEYSDSDKIVKIIDFDGSEQLYTYNELDKVDTYTDRLGNNTCYKYDKMWNVIEKTMPNGMIFGYEYDEMNRLCKLKNNNQIVNQFVYDVLGNRTKIINALNESTIYDYDKNNRIISITNPAGNQMKMVYDEMGNIVETENFSGEKIYYEYNLLGKKVLERDNRGGEIRYIYNDANKLIETIDQAGRSIKREYGKAGLLKKICYPDGLWKVFSYNKNGKVIKEENSSGLSLFYEYDGLGRLSKLSDQSGVKEEYQYNALGKVTRLIDANGNKTIYEYRADGLLETITDAVGSTLNYEYDILGNVVEISIEGMAQNEEATGLERKCQKTIYHRNTIGLVEKVVDSNGYEESFEYDALNRINKITDREGRKTEMSYYSDGNIASIVLENGKSIGFEYDAMGRLIEMSDWNGTINIERDVTGQPVRLIDYKGQETVFEWGALGEKKSTQYSDGSKVYYEYNKAMQLSKVLVNGDTIDYNYNALGQLIEKRFMNGISSQFAYDVYGRIQEISYWNKDSLEKKCQYEYDKSGNKSKIEWDFVTHPQDSYSCQYEYDALNRIHSVKENGIESKLYEYDGFGNRILLKELNKETRYQYDGNRLKNESFCNLAGQVLNKKNYTYDKNGNLITIVENDNQISKFVYDQQNHLVFSETPWGRSENTYSGLGHLLSKNTDEGKIEFEVDFTRKSHNFLSKLENCMRTNYVFDSSITASISESSIFSILTDDLGSVQSVHNKEGKLLSEYSYEEYGSMRTYKQEEKMIFGFTGYLMDPYTGWYYAQERYYDEKTGRFNREDPVIHEMQSVQNRNLYSYCFNQPLTLVDLDGCFPVIPLIIGGAALGFGCLVYDPQGVKSIVDKDYHYARNEINKNGDIRDIDISTIYDKDQKGNIIAKESNGWVLLSEEMSIYHTMTFGEQNNDGSYNRKFVREREDGSSEEIIICFPPEGDPYPVDDPFNAGTFNYGNPKGLVGTAKHFLYDMIPYYLYGNQEEDSSLALLPYRIAGPSRMKDCGLLGTLAMFSLMMVDCLS